MHNHILYAAFTDDSINECRYALLHYLHLYNLKPGPTSITVYTHKPVLFEAFTSFIPHFQMIDISEEKAFQKNGRLQVPSKWQVVHAFLNHHPGNTLFCSTSTFATVPLEPLFAGMENGNVYLFQKEKTDAAKNNWSTAVVGISGKEREALIRMLAKENTDPTMPEKMVDDTAIAQTLKEAANVKPANPFFTSYSDFKEFNRLLHLFFQKNEEESIPNLIKLIHHLNASDIQNEKKKYQQLPLHKKWLNTVLGKAWTIKQYEKKL